MTSMVTNGLITSGTVHLADGAADGLVASRICMQFGGFKAVDDVSLNIGSREVKAVIGPNGAGKSTLFSCLAGTLSPTSGRIYVGGVDLTNWEVARRARHGVVKSFQTTSIFQRMTVRDNVIAAAVGISSFSLLDMVRQPGSRRDIMMRVDEVLEEVRLVERQHDVAATLSHGQQRRLDMGLALACGATILLLDEPTAGMGVDDVADFKSLIKRLRKRCGILLVEHNMDIVLSLSDRITVMAHGKIICEGSPDEVRSDPVVRDVYLGRR
ncbi:MAG TPA: ABC transporter ATP-binding protein [Afipia sp.]